MKKEVVAGDVVAGDVVVDIVAVAVAVIVAVATSDRTIIQLDDYTTGRSENRLILIDVNVMVVIMMTPMLSIE